MSLPTYPELTKSFGDQVVDAVKQAEERTVSAIASANEIVSTLLPSVPSVPVPEGPVGQHGRLGQCRAGRAGAQGPDEVHPERARQPADVRRGRAHRPEGLLGQGGLSRPPKRATHAAGRSGGPPLSRPPAPGRLRGCAGPLGPGPAGAR